MRLRLDAGRATAGLYLLDDERGRSGGEQDGPAAGRARHALLHFRKHLGGTRLDGIDRIPGERTVVLVAGRATLVLRSSGSAPALTLAVAGAAVATIGAGAPAWPPPAPAPEREWDRIDAARFAEAVSAAASDRSLPRAILSVCPTLGPLLARELDGSAASLEALRARLASACPSLHAPAPIEACHDADLAPAASVALAPIPLAARGVVSHPASWREAASLFLELRRRGDRFEARRRRLLEDARRELRRLTQLEAHLGRDRDGLADPETLRRRAEALLASPRALPAGAAEADVPDPYASGARLRFAVDPALSAPANADRFFQKARRLERAREEVSRRLAETADALAAAAERTERAAAARDLAELAEAATPDPSRLDPRQRGGPRHYLTSRGLSLLVGRGARENHRLTFALATPEDLWLHAREVPGAHVILRDNEGRASSDDFREAAEVAAFFSEACAEAKVDVHVTRRKHVRPARGGPGRVHVNHSDTLCVRPRDPEGRLRRR